MAQNDIKRVLAYSTVSQLGYMFLAVGSGAYVAAVFHMITHAFFKALLFLGAGSVIHGMHDDQDMRHMGALRKLLPITASTFIVGWLAIAGVPPFSGFWSKDDILLYAFDYSQGALVRRLRHRDPHRLLHDPPGDDGVLRRGALGRGPSRGDRRPRRARDAGARSDHGSTPHESPWLMWVPLVVLAVGAFAGGVINLPFAGRDYLHNWLEPVVEGSERDARRHRRGLQVVPARRWPRSFAVARHPARLPRLRAQAASRPSSPPSWPTAGTTTRRSPRSWAGPGEPAFEGAATFDAKVDRRRGRRHRPRHPSAPRNGCAGLQSGYVRNYALGIGVGAVAAARAGSWRGGWPDHGRLPAPHRHHRAARHRRGRGRAAARSAPGAGPPGRPSPSRWPRWRSPSPCWPASRPATRGFQFTSFHIWIEQWGIAWNLGVDGISLFLVVLTGLLFPLALLGADPHHDAKPYMAWILLLEAGLLGSFLSLDLFLFFIFFEIVLVPMYFLIGGWGYADRIYAAVKFFLFTMAGSAFMLVGILSTVFLYAQQNGGRLTFDVVEIAQHAELRHHHGPMALRLASPSPSR